MISLLQDLNRNIFRIRLFNNNNIADWKLDDERIVLVPAGTSGYLFVPDNLCIFKVPFSINSINEVIEDPGTIKAIHMGLLPLKGAKLKPIRKDRDITKIGIHFLITSACNMSCSYCIFNNQLKMRPNDSVNFDAIFDKIIEITAATMPKEIDFTFTGGEPLLRFERIVKIVEFIETFCGEKGIKYTFQITTNGSILTDQILSYITEKKFRVTISLDGHLSWYKYTNDSRVLFFDAIIQNYELIKKHCICNIRATIDEQPVLLSQRIQYLYELTSGNLVVQPDVQKPISVDTIVDLLKVDKQDVLNRKRVINYNIRKIFKILADFQYRDFGCGVGTNFFGIDNNGLIIPCSFFTGLSGQTFDSLYEMQTANAINNIPLVSERENCKHCCAKHICGGGCLYTQTLYKNDLVENEAIHGACNYNIALLRYVIQNYELLKANIIKSVLN